MKQNRLAWMRDEAAGLPRIVVPSADTVRERARRLQEALVLVVGQVFDPQMQLRIPGGAYVWRPTDVHHHKRKPPVRLERRSGRCERTKPASFRECRRRR